MESATQRADRKNKVPWRWRHLSYNRVVSELQAVLLHKELVNITCTNCDRCCEDICFLLDISKACCDYIFVQRAFRYAADFTTMPTVPSVYVSTHATSPSPEKRNKQSSADSTSPPMSMSINATTRFPLPTAHGPTPSHIDSPPPHFPETPGTLHEYMTSEVYLRDEATTAAGLEDSTADSSIITSLVTSFVSNETIVDIASDIEEHGYLSPANNNSKPV